MQADGGKSSELIAEPGMPEQAVDRGTKGTHRYRAPALEKGLDILEALAGVSEPLTTPQLAERLRRSPSQLCRIVYILEPAGDTEEWRLRPAYGPTNHALTPTTSHS